MVTLELGKLSDHLINLLNSLGILRSPSFPFIAIGTLPSCRVELPFPVNWQFSLLRIEKKNSTECCTPRLRHHTTWCGSDKPTTLCAPNPMAVNYSETTRRSGTVAIVHGSSSIGFSPGLLPFSDWHAEQNLLQAYATKRPLCNPTYRIGHI